MLSAFFFEFRKLKSPFWEKSKNVPKCGVASRFMRDVPHVQKRFKAVDYGKDNIISPYTLADMSAKK